MSDKFPAILVCVAAFFLGPASHYAALMSLEGLLDSSASGDTKGMISLVVVLFGWVPGSLAAASLSFTGLAISFRDALNFSAGPAVIGMLTSCAVGPTNPFGS